MSSTKLKLSPLPWRTDELNNIYDAAGVRIFEACARDEDVGVKLENEGNAYLVVKTMNTMYTPQPWPPEEDNA